MGGCLCRGGPNPPGPLLRRGGKPLRRGVEELRGQPVYSACHAVFGQGLADAFARAGEILALFGGNAAGHVGRGLSGVGQGSVDRIAALEAWNGQVEHVFVEMSRAPLASGLVLLNAGA